MPMKRKRKMPLVDLEDPVGSMERVIRHNQREFRKRKRHLIADTPNAISWLGRSFYGPVARTLLADPANFDADGMPTEDAMQEAIQMMAETAVNMLADIEACNADDIFHRIRLEAFGDEWGLEDC